MPITANDLEVKLTSSGADRVKGELRALGKLVDAANNRVQANVISTRARVRMAEALDRAIDEQRKS